MFLKVLCDENLPYAVQASLEKRGFDVVRPIPSTPDDEIAVQLKREARIIVTFDSDFANILAYPPIEYSGIVRIAIKPPFIKTIIDSLNLVFQEYNTAEDFKGRLIIVEPGTFRIYDEERTLQEWGLE